MPSNSMNEVSSISPKVNDGVRPSSVYEPESSPEKLEELRRIEVYKNLERKIQNLKLEEQRQQTRLASVRRAITQLRTELEELEDN